MHNNENIQLNIRWIFLDENGNYSDLSYSLNDIIRLSSTGLPLMSEEQKKLCVNINNPVTFISLIEHEKEK